MTATVAGQKSFGITIAQKRSLEAANIECLKAVIAGQQLKLSPTRSELDEVHDTERNLFYFACTRARDRLLVSGVKPASDFFEAFAAKRL